MVVREFDIVIVGLGTCGEDLALQLLDVGVEVAGIEPNLLGGECPYWACIPSKAMIRAGNALEEARRVDQLAGRTEVFPDWARVAARIANEVAGGWDDSYAVARFRDRGGYFVRGWGHLTGPDTVSTGNETLRARKGIVIATGSKPFIPPVPGLGDVDYWTTHDAIQANPLPESLIILGGGAVSCELGQMFSRFGVEVTIVEGEDRLLHQEEPEASEVIVSRFHAEGIRMHFGSRASKVSADRGRIVVEFGDGDPISAEKLLVATGKTVDTSNLGLESAGIDNSTRFIEVDDRLRAADRIWAMGDVTGKAMFTHVGMYQSSIIVDYILGRNRPPADYTAVPRVTFTDPEVGSVGITEQAAREQGVNVAVAVKSVPSTFRGWIHGPGNEGVVKLVVDRSSDTLVGATAVGPNGGEVLGLLSLAVHERTPISNLRSMIYPFPTFHGAIGEAIGAYGRGTGTVMDPDFAKNGLLD